MPFNARGGRRTTRPRLLSFTLLSPYLPRSDTLSRERGMRSQFSKLYINSARRAERGPRRVTRVKLFCYSSPYIHPYAPTFPFSFFIHGYRTDTALSSKGMEITHKGATRKVSGIRVYFCTRPGFRQPVSRRLTQLRTRRTGRKIEWIGWEEYRSPRS